MPAEARTYGNGSSEMLVLLSTYGSRGDVEPMGGLGAEMRVCAPPDFAELLARVGVPLVPVGQPVRPMVHGATPPSAADLPRRAAELALGGVDVALSGGAPAGPSPVCARGVCPHAPSGASIGGEPPIGSSRRG